MANTRYPLAGERKSKTISALNKAKKQKSKNDKGKEIPAILIHAVHADDQRAGAINF
jgi:hypothetical protein